MFASGHSSSSSLPFLYDIFFPSPYFTTTGSKRNKTIFKLFYFFGFRLFTSLCVLWPNLLVVFPFVILGGPIFFLTCLTICCILICRCMQNHNDDTIKTSETVPKKNIPLTFLKALWVRGSWRPNRTATYWPPLYWPKPHFYPFSWAAQPGAWGPSLSETCSSIQHLLFNSYDSNW